MSVAECRFCGNPLKNTFVDLGVSPLANSYLKAEQLHQMEPFYPLHAYVCDSCYLVQLLEFQSSEQIFSDYAYFSSYSETLLDHARRYTRLMIKRFGYDTNSQIIEIASNDGYLLRFFKEKGISVLGVEPAKNVAKVAQEAEIPTIVKFFGTRTAKELVNEGRHADLLIGNNVLAHVPDLNDLVAGMKCLLKPQGVITMEFPHLLRLIDKNQFDTIYHEHFSYFSFITVEKVFEKHGLTFFDVEEISTHGGSLRIYARHNDDASKPVRESVLELKNREETDGFANLERYLSFAERVKATKRNILEFLLKAKRDGKAIAGYGAPAKGNTLLNFCGIRTDFIDYTVDLSPHKQGLFLPGTHIPIYPDEMLLKDKPDYALILAWNFSKEIIANNHEFRDKGGKFIIPIPRPKIVE